MATPEHANATPGGSTDLVGWEVAATGQLDGGLAAAADPGTREHWTGYLKGQAVFRGVPMAGVRRTVRAV